jgi:hypothetical protein
MRNDDLHSLSLSVPTLASFLQVNFKQLTPNMCVGSITVIAIALACRFAATMAVVSQAQTWNWKEKVFAGISWCPKATVQAALWWVVMFLVTRN